MGLITEPGICEGSVPGVGFRQSLFRPVASPDVLAPLPHHPGRE
ncbi:uncharacterized protein METZ01_LOCUS307789 [marine metagenome]|uniref:Uncharacterized protein n=1 Tax=marine metagenome TaxID=408172 RepID=A0A382N3N3_9ZZZZ